MQRRRERYFTLGYQSVSFFMIQRGEHTLSFALQRGSTKRHFFTLQLRKPLIERKRRERINNCLDQLKETVIGAFRLDVSISSSVQIYSTSIRAEVES